MKTYLFFDIVHLIKNVRNNLLSKKKFVFPKFSFELFEDKIEVDAGFVDWSLLHKVHEKDSHLQANLRKAPEITSQVLHPGNKKQNVKLALSIFAETTSAGIKDLLAEGFKYVLTARLQSDPIELHFSKYRQMSGGSFLVSLCDVQNSERILAIDKLLKEGIMAYYIYI